MRLRAILAVTTLLVATAGAAHAASSRDSYVRRHLSFTRASTLVPGAREGLSFHFVVPAAWTPVRSSKASVLDFHVGTLHCRYSVSVTAQLAQDTSETPAEHVTAALPAASSPYVLDEGTRRATMAWRVTRIPSTAGGPVRLTAMRADRRLVAPAVHAWQETVVNAQSRTGDECHAGTYRDVLGPQIGDALATGTGRAYAIKR